MTIRFAALAGFRRFHLTAASARGQPSGPRHGGAPPIERRRPVDADGAVTAPASVELPHDREAPFATRM
ncbi:MAG: hypothetical protein OJF55_002376 [Rhodanobacteraceae bacterium]|jgi:hypothetical protein|nr:MAG: hypothetical protein OJF55_002376 [Rhodanobacteraceae bacterium]